MRFVRHLIVMACALALLCVPAGADAAPAKGSKRVAKMASCKNAAKKKSTAKQRRAATRRCAQRAKHQTTKRRTPERKTTALPEAPKTTAGSGPATAAAAPVTVATTPMQDELVACTNRERVAAQLPELSVDPTLTRAAQGHAQDMNARSYFNHNTPEGTSPWERIRAQLQGADPFGPMGENIATGFAQAQAACDAWMASPGHRENIMNPAFTSIGTGYDSGYAVQDFGGR